MFMILWCYWSAQHIIKHDFQAPVNLLTTYRDAKRDKAAVKNTASTLKEEKKFLLITKFLFCLINKNNVACGPIKRHIVKQKFKYRMRI